MSDPEALLRRAQAAEQAGDARAAVVLYGDGVRALLAKLRGTTDPAERESLQRKADEHFNHAVSLKQQLQRAAGAPPAAPILARQQQACANTLRTMGAVRAFGGGLSMVSLKQSAASLAREPGPEPEPEPEPESAPAPALSESARRRAERADRARREELELQRNRVDVLSKLCESFAKTSHRHTDASLRRVLSWSGGTVATAWQYLQEWEKGLSDSPRTTNTPPPPGGNAASAKSVQESLTNRLAMPVHSPTRSARRGITPQRAFSLPNSSDDDSEGSGTGGSTAVPLWRCSRCMYATYTEKDSSVCYCAQPAVAWQASGPDNVHEPLLQTVAAQRAAAGRRTQQPALGPRGSRKIAQRPTTSTGTRGKMPASLARQIKAEICDTGSHQTASTADFGSRVRCVQMQARENKTVHPQSARGAGGRSTASKSVRSKSSGGTLSRSSGITRAGTLGSPRGSSTSGGSKRSARKTKREKTAGSSVDGRAACALNPGAWSATAPAVATEVTRPSPATSETGSVPVRETHNYASMSVGPKLRLDNLLRDYQPPACPA